MNESLTSTQWFRVAALRPQLDAQARVQRVTYRRAVWHVLQRGDGGRSYRLNAAAYAFVARCNGQLSLQRLWELLLHEQRDAAPTQDELLRLLARLHAAALLSFDRRPDFGPQGVLHAPHGASNSSPHTGANGAPANSLLSFRIPLGRPDALLTALYPLARAAFMRTALCLWAAAVVWLALAAALNQAELAHHAAVWLQTPRMLLITWLCYPVVKALHELGHGLAVKHLGGTVPEWGVTVMMFMPVPYVDASASAGHGSARGRALVSAAGIMVELALAAAGLALALHAQPGWWHDIGLAVFFIGAVSTLVINGNPLLRFDGYHLLCDAFELPNLARRSAQLWFERLRIHLLGEVIAQPLVAAPGERRWLWAYAPAALLWRTLIACALVAWLGGLSFLLGLGVAALLLWAGVLRPAWAVLRHLNRLPVGQAATQRARRRGLGLAGGVLALAALPLPFASVVPGVVWLPDAALLRVAGEGFVDEVLARPGQLVHTGQPLLRLAAPMLSAECQALAARVGALDAESIHTQRSEPTRSASLEREAAALQVQLERCLERQEQLTLRAGSSGRLELANAQDLPGRYLKQGTLVGQVMDGSPSLVRVAVGQEQAALLHARSRGVSVQLAEVGEPARAASLLRDSTGAVTQLPSAALGDRGGGSVPTDPADPHGLKAVRALVLADVQLPASLGERVGGRAWVRFDHGFAPLAMQVASGMQQLFLKHFNPGQ